MSMSICTRDAPRVWQYAAYDMNLNRQTDKSPDRLGRFGFWILALAIG